MTPNLVLGPSAAVGVGIVAHFNPWVLLPVVAVAGYFEGLVVAWLAGSVSSTGGSRGCARRGAWCWPTSGESGAAFTLGCAVVGQEPILVALRWLGVDMRRIWLPLAVSNVVFAVLYYAIVWFGLDQVAKL